VCISVYHLGVSFALIESFILMSVEFVNSIILRIRGQKRESDDLPLVMLDEKSPVDQAEKVQGQDSVMEEISPQ
jgi:hypothetical protein